MRRKNFRQSDEGSHADTHSSPRPHLSSTITQQCSGAQISVKSTDPELDLMLLRVQDVFPDIPSHCILSDLRMTRDVDATITNILEERVDTSTSPEPVPTQTLTSSGLSFKASTFEKNAAGRQLSFAERKEAMYEAARLKYKQKHGLL